jgi:EmrB/QacA subfamily drug resistance transporter
MHIKSAFGVVRTSRSERYMDPPNSPKRKYILLLLFCGVFVGALDMAIVGPALPALQAHFGVDDRSLSWTFTIYVLFNVMATPLLGKLSDVLGRRAVYVPCILVFAAGSLVVACSPSFEVLLAGRAIQGFGTGGVLPVASAVIGDVYPPEKRGGALGIVGAVFGLAFLLGPIVGGLLLMLGWPWLFLVNLPFAGVIALASTWLLPSVGVKDRKPFDIAGITTLMVAIAALIWGVNQLDTQAAQSLCSPRVWPFLAIAAMSAVLLARIELTAIDPVLRPGLFRSRQIAIVSVLAVGAGMAEACAVFVPSFAVDTFGVTESTASFMLVPAVLAGTAATPIIGLLLDRVGARPIVVGGFFLLSAGLGLLWVAGSTRSGFYAAIVLEGLGLAAVVAAPLRYIVLAEARPAEQGAAQALLSLFMCLGRLVSAAGVGAVATSAGGGAAGYRAAFLVILPITGLMAILALLLRPPRATIDKLRPAP